MRLQVLLLLVVSAAILHAYPQRPLDRKSTVADQSATVPSRGGRKYRPDTKVVGDADAWRSERTERRQPARELPSRGRTASRRADYNVHEPETASSVLSPVTQQLITPRRIPQVSEEAHTPSRNFQVEPTEPSRRRPDFNRRSRTRADISSTESSRRSRVGSRRESTSSTEIPRRTGGRRSGSRGIDVSTARSTITTTTQTSSTSEIVPEVTTKATAVETKEEIKATDAPNAKNHVEEISSANTKETLSQSEETVNSRKKEIFSHAEESTGTKRKESASHAEEVLNSRRTEISSRVVENIGAKKTETFSHAGVSSGDGISINPEEFVSARRRDSSNHPQETSIRRKELFTQREETVDIRRRKPLSSRENSAGVRRVDSVNQAEDGRSSSRNGRKSEPSAQAYRSRNSGSARSEDTAASSANTREYRRQPSSNDSPQLTAGDSYVDVPRVTARQRATTTESSEDVVSRKIATRASHRGDIGATRASHRGDIGGQRSVHFKSRTASDGEPRIYQRNFARRGEVSTTEKSTTTPKAREASTRRSNFRSSNFEGPKTAASLKKKKNNVQIVSSSEESIHQEQETLKIQRDSEEVQDTHVGGSSAEDSFITRSSHQVVTVTAYPYSKEQSLPSNVGKRESSRGRTKAVDSYQRVNRVESRSETRIADASSEINKIRPRTANLLLAPSPPMNSAENNVENTHRNKLLVVDGYSQLRSDGNNEDNNVVSTATPFTRVAPRRDNKVLPTTMRGKYHHRTSQRETAVTTEMQRQVPTPSSPLATLNPTISHTGRTGFKQRVSATSENYPPNFPIGKGRSSTGRKPVEPTTESVKKLRSFKDSSVRTTPSFRRSVGSGTEDNRIPSSTTEVSIVTSQSVQSSIPRFSSRYRSDLLRATGLRGTTTPVYVPTVPTVRPTVSTSTTEPAFSAIGKMMSDRGFTRSEVRSHWTNQL